MLEENKNGRKTIWLYAIILFTSAFIVLLLTAYSQIKLNKNIDNYKNQISLDEKTKANFQVTIDSVLGTNKMLSDQLNQMKDQLSAEKSKQEELTRNQQESKIKSENVLANYKYLIAAQNEFIDGNVIECAKILKRQCDQRMLEPSEIEIYNSLSEATFKKAAEKLYFDGYAEYLKSRWESAYSMFELSRELSPYEYYSDDCLFLMGIIKYNTGDDEKAEELLNSFLTVYPDSSYSKDALRILNSI